MHCVLNECEFIAVKNIILRELNNTPIPDLIAFGEAESVEENLLMMLEEGDLQSGEEDLLLEPEDGDEP